MSICELITRARAFLHSTDAKAWTTTDPPPAVATSSHHMAALEAALVILPRHFDRTVTLDHIEELLEVGIIADNDEPTPAEAFACIRNARQHSDDLINELLALSNESCKLAKATTKRAEPVPSTSTSTTRSPNSADIAISISAATQPQPPPLSWAHFTRSSRIDPDQLLAYFTCIVHLAQLRPANTTNRRLGLVAARCYVRLLSVPADAQVYGLFHAPLVQRALELFSLLASHLRLLSRDTERLELVRDCAELLGAFERMLLAVSLDEHQDVKRSLLKTVRMVLFHYLEPTQRKNKGEVGTHPYAHVNNLNIHRLLLSDSFVERVSIHMLLLVL